jgi:hypothetical protein
VRVDDLVNEFVVAQMGVDVANNELLVWSRRRAELAQLMMRSNLWDRAQLIRLTGLSADALRKVERRARG